MDACSPATLRHRVGCDAPWCLIPAAVLHPIAWSLPSWPASCFLTCARRWVVLSPRSPRSCVAQLRRSTAVKPRCRVMPTPSTWRQGLAQRLCFLLPCWHCGRTSSRSPPSCLGAHRHRALAHPCVPCGHDRTLPIQLTVPTLAYGQNSHLTRALHGARCRCASALCECTPALPSC
jgi:hypothetical protein